MSYVFIAMTVDVYQARDCDDVVSMILLISCLCLITVIGACATTMSVDLSG